MSESKPPPTYVQAMLYGPAPFFGYPWKPFLNDVYGGDYEKSYKHFRRQHMDGTNLFYHVLCLVWQLSANYALLGELDKLVGKWVKTCGFSNKHAKEDIGKDAREDTGNMHIVTRATSLLWSWHLLRTSPTPKGVKLASVASICMAHNFLGIWFDRHRANIVFLQVFLEAIGIQRLILNKKYSIGKPSIMFAMARIALWKCISEHEGCFREQSGKVSTALMAWVTAVASSKKPLTVVVFGLFGWILGALTGNKAIYYWSAGMMATLSQGIAHSIAGEAGTLEVLQNDGFDQTRYELSHVAFFPNLIFQACYAHLKSLM